MSAQREHPGSIEAAYRSTLDGLLRGGVIDRLHRRDASLWAGGGDAAMTKAIQNRLGWIDSPGWARERTEELRAFAESVRAGGFTRVLLLGMGGSSLAPEVLARVLGPAPGAPTLDVLDSTVPSAVLSADAAGRLDRTFFLVSSKSGRTVETLSQYRYFRVRVEAERLADPPARFAVITDAGSDLDALAGKERIARVFRNPPDIGGRYSALSYFGLVPAALLGVHLDTLIARAERERAGSRSADAGGNAALRLGAFLGAAAKSGRDKLTLLMPPDLRPLGYWIEQLVAESTGKSGTGIVPVEGEPIGSVAAYSEDRVFAVIQTAGEPSEHLSRFSEELRHAGAPVVELTLDDRDSLAGAFYRWEVATAVAGTVLGINPFDEPNVQESKDNTARLLAGYAKTRTWAQGEPRTREGDVEVYATDGLWDRILGGAPSHPSLERVLGRFLALAAPHDYLALLGYLERTAAAEASFARLRRLVRDAVRLPVLQGYGPRYLHSIGQLYKGGPGTGLFLVFTEADPADCDIPGVPYGFGDLRTAQALGDLESLASHGKPALRLHLAAGLEPGLATVAHSAERALVALAAGA